MHDEVSVSASVMNGRRQVMRHPDEVAAMLRLHGTAARLGVVTLSGLIRSEVRLVLAGVRHETVPAYATHHAARHLRI